MSFSWLASLLCLLSLQSFLLADAGRMRFMTATTPYNYDSATPAPTTPTIAPTQPISRVTSAPFVPGSPAPTFNSLPPTAAALVSAPTPVPASPSPTQSNFVTPTQCPGSYACAAAGGVSAFNGSLVAPQCYPYGTYVNSAGQPVTINSQCIPAGNDAVSLKCPAQSDAPQSHGASVQDNVCYVYDPYRKEAPWASSTAAFAQCYNPVEYVCTATNLLCPISAPYACGRACFSASEYRCVVNPNNLFLSTLTQASGSLATQSICPAQPTNSACPTTKPT